MTHRLTLPQENHDLIKAVENSFGHLGKPLSQPDRVLIGHGRLTKLSRRGPKTKSFFLFNDVLVYGGIVLNGRWHKKQKIIPLEDVQLEDLEDSFNMKNQWLIRTPRKSFFMGAPTCQDKQEWMQHIESCRSKLLQTSVRQPGSVFAVTWVPDQASAICMRCCSTFTVTHRRHHCRKCGFVVCNSCSKHRVLLRHIDPKKRQRICRICHSMLSIDAPELAHVRGDSMESSCSGENEVVIASDEDQVEESMEDQGPTRWLH
ncbi:pleckstrin homology domain-containing family F member 2-like [Thalassophryne amazonica]|uniref:pleckstrin homology domain-containing family F member 2-like n=1 Tax=Thalassophryne amazonica TaxID=390379 RepID=UPI0014717C78|nr:pleckstrin homology domain-containing family F member 2-like [Thalassophryne amazonica]